MNTKIVPLLCTRGAVIFPNQDLSVEVGRKPSIDAVEQASRDDSMIFIVSQKDISVEKPDAEDIFEYGTLSIIKNFRRKEENHYRVVFEGKKVAKIIRHIEKDGVNFVEVEEIEDVEADATNVEILTKRVVNEISMMKSLNNNPNLFKIIDLLKSGLSSDELVYSFGQYMVLNIYDKQRILEENSLSERLMLVLELIYKEKEVAKIEEHINSVIKERIEDSQKEYYLREKIKAIKEELNEAPSSGDMDDLKEKVMSEPYPENIKEKALDEFKRYDMMPSSSSEAVVIRSYLEWLLQIPWYQKSDDNDDLKLASRILDEDHYGLEKVKERILEYLAVKQMTNSLKSPIICLVGPPGVGKTSLARSVARALDRKFVKISLGGVKDEAEIRGHRRTYIGSMPGRIIQGMKKAGVLNPVFLIDEIDKMASDYKGDPSSAMLEVLDPEQNFAFSDHYIEEPYDLSDVLFIATANYIDNIPSALKDRLEIINLSSYTEIEKEQIAIKHLIPKQLEINGLKSSQFNLSNELILYLIRHYTREAGVRQLERVIGSLCRKSVLSILKDEKKTIKVSKKKINEWLGHEFYDYGAKEKNDQIGVVTGLAYTSFGGDILPVEVNYFKGKGNLIVTGQLGDVMQESAKIALDYVKANADKYKIENDFFETHDIHIHVPEGAVPKDGPSAGVTLTTALISAITKTKVRSDLAMTGEVTLRGNVLPIGGLKEKSLAAHRSGIDTIVFPKGNIKDLDDVPDTVKNDIKFIPVERVDQVIKEAFIG